MVQGVPHYDHPAGGYDGKFYVNLAVDPLARSPDLAASVDVPTFRARRILIAWTAWATGLGNPALIVHVFALQNVVAWLLMAWLLERWMPPLGARHAALWAASLLGYGALTSVRWSLTDLPAVLLVACAVALVEQRRFLPAAIAVGLAGLARETALLAAVMLAVHASERGRHAGRAIGLAVLAALPLVAWSAYLALAHDWRITAGAGNVGTPLAGFVWKLHELSLEMTHHGLSLRALLIGTALVAFVAQCAWLALALLSPKSNSPWTLVAATFAGFVLLVQLAPWGEAPGAYNRITLPTAIGVNVALAAESSPRWGWIVVTNFGVVPGVLEFVFRLTA